MGVVEVSRFYSWATAGTGIILDLGANGVSGASLACLIALGNVGMGSCW